MSTYALTSYKVKQAILLLKTFTVAQLMDITGLDHASVETVVQRLRKEEVVVPVDQARSSGRGRPRQVYELSSDRETAERFRAALDEFRETLEAFEPIRREPDSAYYREALAGLDALETGRAVSPQMLDEIESQLSFARRYETLIDEGRDSAAAYLDFAAARVAAARGNLAEHNQLLQQARQAFEDLGAAEELSRLDDYALGRSLEQKLHYLNLEAGGAAESQPVRAAMAEVLAFVKSPSVAAALLGMANVADSALAANAGLRQENNRLQAQVKVLTQEKALLQDRLILDLCLQTPKHQALPSYSEQILPPAVLKEKPADLVDRNLLQSALMQEYWPEGQAEMKARQSRTKYTYRRR